MSERTFVGFGFGAIQAGLFLYEAHRSGRFDRLVVAEVMPDMVQAIRDGGGIYRLNVATAHGIQTHEIPGIEIYNPRGEADRTALVAAIAEARELATALPSVTFYGQGEPGSVTALLAAGLRAKRAGQGPQAVIYTAENHNHAAEILESTLRHLLGSEADILDTHAQCLNTVIGKMSGVVADERQIAEQRLARVTGKAGRCFLVEAFNRILITRIRWENFDRGIDVFVEKPDLLPFEEAKLYGHNATHALLGYLASRRGLAFMADAVHTPALLDFARAAFLEESGAALCRKHAGLDPLFTPAGYRAYVDDLIERMVNPHLRDAVERIIRDPRRKLGWDDRLIGTLRVVLSQGGTPSRYAVGAAAASQALAASEGHEPDALLREIWGSAGTPGEQEAVLRLIHAARRHALLRD